MKHLLHPFLLSALLLAVGLPLTTHADTTAPMFGGNPLNIQGQMWTWASATEDGPWHLDAYTNLLGETVTVTGMIGFPDLATVAGNGTSTVNGHLSLGTYGDNEQSTTEQGEWLMNGYYYSQRNVAHTFYPDLTTGQLLVSSNTTYSGSSGSYSQSTDASGNTTWSQTLTNSQDTSTPSSGSSSFELFGTTYTFSGGSYDSGNESSTDGGGNTSHGSCYTNWVDNYTSADGGWLRVSSSGQGWAGIIMAYTTSIHGWDPYAGSFSAPDRSWQFDGIAGLTWEPRTAPSFAPAQLWVNGMLVNWQWGEIASNGTIIDHYFQNGSEVLVITGHAREFAGGSSSASVTVNGSGAGTYTAASGFSNDQGPNIQTSEPSPDPGPDPDPGPQGSNHSTPFFSSALSLWVNDTEYPFSEGYEDGYGNRTDTYVNTSAGTVTLSGSTSNSSYASLTVSHYGGIDYGYYLGSDTFQIYSYSISTTASCPPQDVLGLEAYWVRGHFYTRAATDSNTFQCAAGHTFVLERASDGVAQLINGTDNLGSYGGTLSGEPGMFLIPDQNAELTVVAIPADTDGTLQLAEVTAPENCPPAVMITGLGVWQFVGLSHPNVANYIKVQAASSTDSAEGGGLMLRISMVGQTSPVHLVNCQTGVVSTGTYDVSSHLFQTSGPDSGFPMPVYGVDPNENDLPWLLEVPAGSGLPSSFIVRGEPWWYAGADAQGNHIYRGFYIGQEMILDAADASGQRLVTLTDPVFNNGSSAATYGTLSGERKSVRLRDGTLVLSGDQTGQQVAVQHQDQYKLHTIAADLDLVGNNLSFGILHGDASLAGALFQFQDVLPPSGPATTTLHSILSRTQAQWVWSRATSNAAQTARSVMQLDAASKLTLYDHASGDAGVVLDPTPDGVSTIRGVLRVRPGGDIPMAAEFQAGEQP